MTHRVHHRFILPGALAAMAATVAVTASVTAQLQPRTWQEEQAFKAGPTPFEPLMRFWYELDRISDQVSIRQLTRTLLGRELTLVTISKEPIASPQDALRSGKTIVLIANAVHGNEPAGKEASQLVARDLVSGDLRHILDSVIVLFVPLINPDGGEVPRRTNEEGFDMNRDYIKLESQEIYALVTQVMNQWTPDIHIDTHHGGAAPYTLTWQGTLNPAADSALRAYPYATVFPEIRQALRREGYDGFDYSGSQTRDGIRGWGSTSVEARKHHVYTGLVNSIGMLFETPSSTHRVRNGVVETIPLEDRYFHQVRGEVIGMRAVLEHAARERTGIRALTSAARARAVRAGTAPAARDQVVVAYELVSRGSEPVWMPGERGADSLPTYRQETVPIWLRYNVTRTVPRPRGYILPASIAKVVPLLLDHGIQVHRFTAPASLELEVYHATGIRHSSYFQGHYLKEVTGVEKKVERVDVPAGWYYVSTAQAKGRLVSYLLEPETDDNLITWGYTDNVLRVTPATREEAIRELLGDTDAAALTDAQRTQLERRADAMLSQRQRVPMMRVLTEQPKSLLEVTRFGSVDRTRYWQP